MNLDSFDEHLRSVLDNIEVPYDPADWSALADRLEQLPPADGSWMDAPLAQRLEAIAPSYQSAHWEQMAARLDEVQRRRRMIYFYKLVEAAIFLLLIGQVLFMQTGFDPDGGPVVSTAGASEKEIHSLSTPRTHRDRSHLPSAPAITGPVQSLTSAALAQTGILPFAGTFERADSDPVAFLISAAQQGNNATTSDLQQAGAPFPAVVAPAPLHPAAEFLPALPASLLAARLADSRPAYTRLQKARPRAAWYVGASAGIQVDKIEPGRDLNRGLSTEAQVVWRKGKWSAYTGMRYMRRQFVPQAQVVVYAGDPFKGQYGAYVGEGKAQVLSIPAHVSRRVARVGKVSAHIVAGCTAHVAATKGFQTKTVYYPGASPNPIDPTAPPSYAYEDKGFLEGGQWKNNHYVTADAGVRVEASLGQRAALFAQGLWQKTIGGDAFSEPAARINGTGLYAGVVTRF